MADDGPRHIDHALPTNGHRQMYNSHKYFGRKPADVISAYVERYTDEDDVVLDPFCGSGVHVAEAVRTGRRGVGFDVNPFSPFLARNTIRHVDPDRIEATFDRIAADVRADVESLYRTTCRDCGADLPAICFTWEEGELVDARYDCSCRDDRSIEDATDRDRSLYARIDRGEVDAFFDADGTAAYPYPTDDLSYPDGSPFVERQEYDSVDDLFTARNLVALARLRDRIDRIDGDALRGAFEQAFSSMLHLASTMTPVRPSRPFSSAWTQHSYWSADAFMEQNVWTLFERATLGRQGVVKAKRDQPDPFVDAREAGSVAGLVDGEGDYYLDAADAVEAVSAMPDGSVDYVVTDPPYGGSIQYGELLYMWESWLGLTDGLADVADDEIVINERQGKDEATYERLLRRAFEAVHDALEPGGYCTVTFHNPKLRYRALLVRALIGAGFAFENVVYQPPPRPSAKGLLQPFGSLAGDYFFRFRKPESGRDPDTGETVDHERLERIVVETAAGIIADRGEPTHYTFVQNAIDPELYAALRDRGLSTAFDPTDVEAVLRDHVGDEFRLVETEVAERNGRSVTGTGWWFTDPSAHPIGTSLRRRVEATVTDLLRRERTVAFDDVLGEVYTAFADSLTPEERTIEDVLSANATEVRRGTWRVDPAVDRMDERRAGAIRSLELLGDRAGYDVGSPDDRRPRGDGRTGVLWRDDEGVAVAFEVEDSTAVVDAVIRGEPVPESARRVLVVPDRRVSVVRRRFDHPGVREMAGDRTWTLLTYDAVERVANDAPAAEVTLGSLLSRARGTLPGDADDGT